MGITDIKFGWTTLELELSDIQISANICLEEFSQNKWSNRDGGLTLGFASSDELTGSYKEAFDSYENPDHLRYSDPKKFLMAKATSVKGIYQDIFIGTPKENPENTSFLDAVDDVGLIIREVCQNKPLKEIDSGNSYYLKNTDNDSNIPKFFREHSLFAQLNVPSEVFDEIEKWLSKPRTTVQVSLNKKGWHLIGPIDDKQIYFSNKKQELVELLRINFNRKL